MDRTGEYGSEYFSFLYFAVFFSNIRVSFSVALSSHCRRLYIRARGMCVAYGLPRPRTNISLSLVFSLSPSFSLSSILLFSPRLQSLDPANDSWKNNSGNERATTVERWDSGAGAREKKKRLDLATQREEWHVGDGGRSGEVTRSRVQILSRGPLRPNWPSESISARPLSVKLRRYVFLSLFIFLFSPPREKKVRDNSKWRENKSYRAGLRKKVAELRFFFIVISFSELWK